MIEYRITVFDGHRTCSYEEWIGKSKMKTLTNVQVWMPTDCKVYKVLGYSADRDYNVELQIEKSYPVINERKSKMTREEAIKKIEIIANKSYDAIPAKNLVDALEALGSIKFEEEEKPKELFYDPASDITVNEVKGKIRVSRGKIALWTEQ